MILIWHKGDYHTTLHYLTHMYKTIQFTIIKMKQLLFSIKVEFIKNHLNSDYFHDAQNFPA